MDYRRVYREFIEDRRLRGPTLTLYETHHILPRHLKGDDSPENLVRLPHQDHLFAHVLLARIHGHLMSTCLTRMLGMRKYAGRRSRLRYEWARAEHKRIVSLKLKGVKKSPEHLAKMRANFASPEWRAKVNTPERSLKVGRKGVKKPESHREKHRAFWADPERREKILAQIRHDQTPETREKIRSALRGRVVPEDQREKMRKPKSPEGRENIARAQRARHEKIRQERDSASRD